MQERNEGYTGQSQTVLFVVSEDRAFLSHRMPMACAARDAGFDVHVATSLTTYGPTIEAHGFTVHSIPFERGALSPFATIETIFAIRKVERTIAPVLVHQVGLQCSILGAIAGIRRKTTRINAFTGLGHVFTSAKSGALRFFVTTALRLLLAKSNSFTLVQNSDDRLMMQAWGISAERVALIPGSGVDTDALRPIPEPDGLITVGFAGRLLGDKGIRALLAAHRLLRDKNLEIRLLIAGQPDPNNPSSVSMAEAEEWNKYEGVQWLGHIEDIASLWGRCHIACLPSHREGLPMSLLEAAALGRPLIATDAPGCRELVIHERTGLLIPIDDVPALASAITRLANSAELRRQYGIAARELVSTTMSASAVGAATVQLYRKLLGRSDYSAPAK